MRLLAAWSFAVMPSEAGEVTFTADAGAIVSVTPRAAIRKVAAMRKIGGMTGGKWH
jgi:hypothetical protein